ncbi:peptide-methionine (S)-S-oxide reductase [Enemella dayhoffiae]|uniref:Peptide methionine sulfoxide reductase MsrA n=2 Tax=Enemella dayhoffiae TaxID=2016507 RepID=A0A255GX58_9ACTN|nr:peptide-methionine (S)-S-oxide reductase [Enemella dayhoffiae]
MVSAERAFPGRAEPVLATPTMHRVLGTEVHSTPAGCEEAYLALGCFWGAEKLFWQLDGVRVTAAGYQGGFTPNPTYEEVCFAGRTGHAETVRVVFDPSVVSYADLLKVFFENHDPTQGMRQGNDVGTQYRSAIFTTSPAQAETAKVMKERFADALAEKGFGEITTELVDAPEFFWAEDYHQQYLDANPNGYCPVHSTGVKCGPI